MWQDFLWYLVFAIKQIGEGIFLASELLLVGGNNNNNNSNSYSTMKLELQ